MDCEKRHKEMKGESESVRRGSVGADPCQGGRSSPADGEGKRRRKDAVQGSHEGIAAGALTALAMLYLCATRLLHLLTNNCIISQYIL